MLSGSQTESTVIKDPNGKEKLYVSKHLSENKSSASLYMILSVDVSDAYQKISTIMFIEFIAVSALLLLYTSKRA